MSGKPVRKRRSRKVKPGDNVASAVIMSTLVAVFLVVFVTGTTGESRLFGAEESEWTADKEVLPDSVHSLALVDTWIYGPATLYEYINGQAPHYIQFGFQALLVGSYAPPETAMPSLIIDVYDMAERRNAYGMYMESFPPEEQPADLGNDGFISENVAVFWKGPFYVRVVALTDDVDPDMVRTAAEKVAAGIEDDSRVLQEFDAFPEDGMVSGSASFAKEAAFGLHYMEDTFIASYQADDVTYRLFFVRMEDADAVGQLVEEHQRFLDESGNLWAVEESEGVVLVWGEHQYLGSIMLISRDSLVVGSLRLDDREVAESVVRQLLANVRQLD